jgi:predicted GTPase
VHGRANTTNMNMTKQTLVDSVQLLTENNLPLSELAKLSVERLETPRYRIGFVGQYQVGKSTLINRVFLRDDLLLKEGSGLCTTAIPTEIVFGEARQLEVIPWDISRQSIELPVENGITTGEVDVITGVSAPRIFANPSTGDIQRATTASDEAARTELAKTTAAIRISWPRESLRKYSLFDTPGINDPNTTLLDNTTYRLLPTLDVAVLVVEPRELGQIELQFLRGRMLEQGLSRIMILVSVKPNQRELSDEQRADILCAIRGQLQAIGRGYISVQMYCFDANVGGNILSCADSIEQAIHEFLSLNVEPARIARAIFAVKRDLHSALLSVATRQAFAGKAEAERRALLAKIAEAEEELKESYKISIERVGFDLGVLEQRLELRAKAQVAEIGEKYLQGFHPSGGLAAAQSRLYQADNLMKREIECVVFDILQTARDEVDAAVKRQSDKIRTLMDPWQQLLSVDLKIDGGVIGKVPPLLIDIGDILLTFVLLPGGPLANLFERFIASLIPLLSSITPREIVADLMIRTIKDSVNREMERISDELGKHLNNVLSRTRDMIRQEFDASFRREVASVRASAGASLSGAATENEADLAKTRSVLESLFAKLEGAAQ